MMFSFGIFLVLLGICSGSTVSTPDTDNQAGSEDSLIGYLDDYNCPSQGGAFPWHICDKYVTCYGSSPAALMQCKYDHLFDLRYSGCNYPELTDCGNRTLPGGVTSAPTTTTTMGGGNTPSFVCPSDGSFRDPYDCSSFYICSSGMPTLIKCKSGLVYNYILEVCDYPENVDCSAISTIPSNGTTPLSTIKVTTQTPNLTSIASTQAPNITLTTPEPEQFVCPTPDGSFSNPNDCASFYYCNNGVPVLVACKPGLLYNPDLEICDKPEAVDCEYLSTAATEVITMTTVVTNAVSTTATPTNATRTTTKPTATTGSSAFTCSGLTDGIYANPDDCSKFYQCSNGQALVQSCSPGLTFNPDKDVCDFPYNFYPPCGTRFRCPTSEGHFANPNDCSSFYVCSNGESYQQYCNPPLVFNTAVNVCDFTFNVPPPCGTLSVLE